MLLYNSLKRVRIKPYKKCSAIKVAALIFLICGGNFNIICLVV